MNPLTKVFDRLTLLSLRLAFRELRACHQLAKDWIDTYRQVHGLPPLYAETAAAPEPVTFAEEIGKVLKPGDYLSYWAIGELALENNILVDDETNLEQLALDRGWISPEGHFLVLPHGGEGLGHDTRALLLEGKG